MTSEPITAIPATPPSSRVALVVADAMPILSAGTRSRTAMVIGLKDRPMPVPIRGRVHQKSP